MKKILTAIFQPFLFAIVLGLMAYAIAQMIGHEQTVGIIFVLLAGIRFAFWGGKAAGAVAIIAAVLVLAFLGYTKFELGQSKNITLAKYTQELRKNNGKTAAEFAPEAPGQSNVFQGVMAIATLHAAQGKAEVDSLILEQVGKSHFSGKVEDEGLYKLAEQVAQNTRDYNAILRAADIPVAGTPEKPKSVDLTINLKNSDGDKVTVQPGEKVELSVKEAKYSIMPVIYNNPPMIVDNFVDADGQVVDDPDDRFIAPTLPRYGTMYRVGDGRWKHLGMGVTAVEKNDSGELMEITISVNDIKSTFNNSHTFENNKGTLVISIERSDITYASTN